MLQDNKKDSRNTSNVQPTKSGPRYNYYVKKGL